MAVHTPRSPHQEFQKLVIGKALRAWTTDDVTIWLNQMNDGLFAKYSETFQNKKIDGKILMTLDDDKKAAEILGTNHQITTFTQSIKQLKSKNGRRRSSSQRRRKQSRRGQSLQAMLFSSSQLRSRSQTPSSKHSKSNSFHISVTKSPMCNDVNSFQFSAASPSGSYSPYSLTQSKSQSFDIDDFKEETTDKHKLWKKYSDKQTYSAILFKRGKYNKKFKKRWLVLCEDKKLSAAHNRANTVRGASNSFAFNKGSFGDGTYRWPSSNNVLSETNEVKREKKKQKRRIKGCYLFYFDQRPVKDNDYPNGYVNLGHVECVIGLFDDQNDVNRWKLSKEKKIKYLKNVAKDSEYYEIILKTKHREWIFGAIDSSSYASWLIRLKKFE